MTYILFVYDRPDSLSSLSEGARQAIYAEYEALQAIRGLTGQRLAPASNAVTLQIQDDSPTQEPKPLSEQLPLTGFYLLEPDDREHALEIAARIPAARLGGAIEVRALVSEP
jgi:hypothetical protein